MTYNEAFNKLEELVEELEDGNIQLDELTLTVKHAKEYIQICELKLRGIESDVKQAINGTDTKSVE